MGAIRLQEFAGELPAIHPDKLPMENAQVAENARLLSGALEAWNAPSKCRDLTLSSPRTVFRTQYGSWLEWSDRCCVTNSVHSSDPYNRVFFTGVGQPSVADYSQAVAGDTPGYYRLGVPIPEKPSDDGLVDNPNYEPENGDEDEDEDEDEVHEERTYYYVVTLVNEFGEEGVPSDPLGPLDVPVNKTVEIGLPRINHWDHDDLDNVSFDEEQVPIVEYYIYRSSGGPFQFIASVSASEGSFVDSIEAGAEAEQLESEEWYPPPDNLAGLTVVAGNFLAAYRKATEPGEQNASAGNEVLFSESGLPHAWPTAYRLPVDYEVVALGSFGQTLVVLTKGSVFLGQGSSPAGMALTNTNIQQPCLAEESVVSLQGGVVYASPDGLVYVTDQGPQVVTQSVFTRREWQRFNPETIRASSWYHQYVAFYDGEDGPGAFVFDPRNPEQGIVRFDTPYPSAVFTDLEEGRLYFAVDDELREWNAGSRLTYRWRSRSMMLPRPQPIRVVRVWADRYPVNVRIYRDGFLQGVVYANSDSAVRVPGGSLARHYEIEIEGSYPVYDVALGPSMASLLEA